MTTRLTFFRLLLQQLPYVGQAVIKGILGFRIEMPVGDVDDVLCSLHGSPHVAQRIGVRRATHELIGQADVWQYAVLQICSTVSILSHQMQVLTSMRGHTEHGCVRTGAKACTRLCHLGTCHKDASD